MKKQQYSNHVRYYIPHHFVFLPMMAFFIVLGIVKARGTSPYWHDWALFSVLSFAILYLGIMLRQHYALGNQNRIVRLEFRLRYFELYGSRSIEVEKQLTFGQIAALRFASDEEFKILLNRAMVEKIGAKEIKKSIRDWQGDYMRV